MRHMAYRYSVCMKSYRSERLPLLRTTIMYHFPSPWWDTSQSTMLHLTELSQILLTENLNNVEIPNRRRVCLSTQAIPACAATASLAILLVSAIVHSRPVRRLIGTQSSSMLATRDGGAAGHWQRNVVETGGKVIFAFKFCRLYATLVLLILDVYSAYKKKWDWDSVAMMASVIYIAFLAVLSAFARCRIAVVTSTHLTLVAFTAFLVYSYRDIWPLMTFTLRPSDEVEGALIWVKVALTACIGVVMPLLEPYPYISAKAENSTIQPNPEHTASIASFLFYTFMDSTIWRAYHLPHLSYDQLPLLCDYDDATNLKQRSYPYLDPFSDAKKSRLVFGLARVFRSTLFYQSAVLVLMALARMTSPVATNRLLNYLEQGREDSLVRPWVWIILIAAGPMAYSLTHQLYQFLSATTCVRIESILTSLVFDHALRLRVKAEVSDKISATSTTQAGSDTEEAAVTGPLVDADAEPDVESDDLALVKNADQIAKPAAESENFPGKVSNLITSDLDNITSGRDFLLVALSSPLEVSLSMWFLYKVLGWSSIIGFFVMIAFFPLPTWVASFMDKTEVRKMKATDARVENVTEMMSSLRMVKLFGWESYAKGEACKKRDEELKWIWLRRMLEITIGILNYVIPMLHMIVTYTIYTTIMKQELNASIVFSSLGAFTILRDHIFQAFHLIPTLIRANVSLRRVEEFFKNAELQDYFIERPEDTMAARDGPSSGHTDDIGFGAATFAWVNEQADGAVTPSERFRLQIEENLTFKRGGFNIIVGPTGSGKTSILMALLGEMHYIPSRSDSWCNLPRGGGVAYAAQESWVQNETIKDNIMFGAPYDEERYQKVIYQCALKLDLKLLNAGDATEVGEKGLTLSGGQKARITLARAIYSSASILLLDDVLSALDTHTARWIVSKCFQGDLVKGRTVILVTHNTGLVAPIADFVVCLGTDGRVDEQGTALDVLAMGSKAVIDVSNERVTVEDKSVSTGIDLTQPAKDGKLIVAEEVEVGHIGRPALTLFFRALGGDWPVLFWSQYIFAIILTEIFDTMEFWWLGWWARQYQFHDRGDVSITFYLGVYVLIVFVGILFFISHTVMYASATLRSSRTIYRKLISALVGSTFRWLDVTPISRVITRCTQDIQAVDGSVTQSLSLLVLFAVSLLTKLGAILIYAPVFLLGAAVVAAIGGYLAQIYIKAQLPVKREMSNAKAPVLGIFAGAVAGLTSIRAYGAQQAFKDETARCINRYVRCARTFYTLNRWISVRIDSLSAIFAASLALYFTYGSSNPNPSNIGFILIMATSFSNMILWFVQIFKDFEVSGNSLERIQQYILIEQEPEPIDHGTPPAYWPASGELRVENLCACYSPDGPLILKDLSFHIKAGERVGIVGRTGSGKSTLTLSLLRCIFTEGTVYYDGLPTHTLTLDALRSNVTIIPQVPELLSGTLRQNLDMFSQCDDATLNDALHAAGLLAVQPNSGEGRARMTLDSPVVSGGGNFSVGQRQMVAIARAIVRKSKLLILDEATSAIDYEADAAIQALLRTELARDVTVLTVAHRLQTIMDSDRIMVLDGGRITEFDIPMALIRDEKSFLRALVEESAEKEALYAMMNDKA